MKNYVTFSFSSRSMTMTATLTRRTSPSWCGVRRPRAADHPSLCPHATRSSPLRPRLSSAGRRPSAGVQVSPGAVGPGIWSVCTLYFLNNSVLTPISLPLSQIRAANFGTGQLVAAPPWACRFEAGSPRAGRWSITVEQPRRPPPRHPVAPPLRRRSAATGTHHEWGEPVMIWGMCGITFLIHGVLNPFFPAFIADFCCYCSSWTTEGDVGNQVPFFYNLML